MAFSLSFFIGSDDGTGRQKFHPQKSGVRARVRWFDREFAVKEFRLSFICRDYPRRNQKFLAGLRVLGQKHGQNIVIAAAIENRPVREDGDHQALWTAKSQIHRHPRALRGIAIDLLGNLNPAAEHAGSRPMLLVRIASPGPDAFFTVSTPQSESFSPGSSGCGTSA